MKLTINNQLEVHGEYHLNPDGQLGGFVCNAAYVEPLRFIDENTIIVSDKQFQNANIITSMINMCDDIHDSVNCIYYYDGKILHEYYTSNYLRKRSPCISLKSRIS